MARWDARRERGPDRADPLGGVGQVKASLDDAREEVTRAAEETAGVLLGGLSVALRRRSSSTSSGRVRMRARATPPARRGR